MITVILEVSLSTPVLPFSKFYRCGDAVELIVGSKMNTEEESSGSEGSAEEFYEVDKIVDHRVEVSLCTCH